MVSGPTPHNRDIALVILPARRSPVLQTPCLGPVGRHRLQGSMARRHFACPINWTLADACTESDHYVRNGFLCTAHLLWISAQHWHLDTYSL